MSPGHQQAMARERARRAATTTDNSSGSPTCLHKVKKRVCVQGLITLSVASVPVLQVPCAGRDGAR